MVNNVSHFGYNYLTKDICGILKKYFYRPMPSTLILCIYRMAHDSTNENYRLKYLKYRYKYLNLKSQIGGNYLQDAINNIIIPGTGSFDEKEKIINNWLPENECEHIQLLERLNLVGKSEFDTYYFDPFMSDNRFKYDTLNRHKILIRLDDQNKGGIVFTYFDQSHPINHKISLSPHGDIIYKGIAYPSLYTVLDKIKRSYQEAKQVSS